MRVRCHKLYVIILYFLKNVACKAGGFAGGMIRNSDYERPAAILNARTREKLGRGKKRREGGGGGGGEKGEKRGGGGLGVGRTACPETRAK